MRDTPKKEKEQEEGAWASPKEQQEMKHGKSRNQMWYLGHEKGYLIQNAWLMRYSSTLVTLTIVTILLLVNLARHLCAGCVSF